MRKKQNVLEVSSNVDEINFDAFLQRFAHVLTGVCCTDDTQLKIIFDETKPTTVTEKLTTT